MKLYFNHLNSIVKNHMNKKHWNTINPDGTIPDKEVFSWIDHSYQLVTGKG
jgi:predicted DNA-binding protein (MmcQ/YjbR family)